MKESVVIDYNRKSLCQTLLDASRHIPRYIRTYLMSMFPIFQWIHRYNTTWLLQDAIAGITVGIVVVPQSMAYAKLAGLDPQYGLYTSFVGASIYCFFGTSKDISIGPISTVSLLVGQAVATIIRDHPEITAPEVAVTLTLFAGIITTIIGVVRLGILVDFIPGPAIAGYMTGSAITITLSQLPGLAGTSNHVDTHHPPYSVLVQFLTSLQYTRLDLAFGGIGLVLLYGIKILCDSLVSKVSPRLRKPVFVFGIMRNGLIVIFGTLVSFLVNLGQTSSPIQVIETVPAGFDAMAVPSLNMSILKQVGSVLPSIILILILEHVSVAKSFGRIYNYTINPDQEIFTIGVSNMIGSFFGAFPATGGFSRTAIMARSGVRSPMAGVFSGAVVILALYALTPAFYYIPEAVLAAVVIHAVSDLVSGPKYLKELWTAGPFEFLLWCSAVLVTFFVSVETGIYVAVGLSLAGLLLRLARPPLQTLSRVAEMDVYAEEHDPNFATRLEPLQNGILVLKPTDSILYPNAGYIAEGITTAVKKRTRCGNTEELQSTNHNQAWNQSLDKNAHHRQVLPVLRAIVFDFSAVRRLDATAIQMLVTVRHILNDYAGRAVEWHFVHLTPQVRHHLVAFGFGSLTATNTSRSVIQEKPDSTDHHTDMEIGQAQESHHTPFSTVPSSFLELPYERVLPRDCYPCFHWDIDMAIASIQQRWPKDFQDSIASTSSQV